MTPKKQSLLQIASFACVIHCILAPSIVIFVPLLGSVFQNIWIELAIFFTFIFCGAAIIYSGFCQHKRRHVFAIFTLGVTFWLLHLAFEIFELMDLEGALLFLGTIFVLGSYYFNHRNLKCCSDEQSHI